MDLSISIISNSHQISELAKEWSDLLGRSAANEPMLSPEWLLSWWRVFGPLDGRRLQAVTFRSRGRLVGLAPLLARRHAYPPGIPFRRLEFLGSGERIEDESCSEYLNVIAERGAEEAVGAALGGLIVRGGLGAWDELSLAAMDGSSAVTEVIAAALRQTGAQVSLVETNTCRYIDLPATWEAYLESLSSSSRYLINRSLRDFEKWTGPNPELRVATTEAELAEGRRALISLHGERWSGGGVFSSPRFSAFHDAAMPALFARGALELIWMVAKGEPVAALYNVVWGDKVYFYQSGRSLTLPKGLRPGIVMHAHAIRRAIALGRREYDFLGGASQYKRQLASGSRPLVRVRAVRPGLLETTRIVAARGLDEARKLSRAIARRGRPEEVKVAPAEAEAAPEPPRASPQAQASLPKQAQASLPKQAHASSASPAPTRKRARPAAPSPRAADAASNAKAAAANAKTDAAIAKADTASTSPRATSAEPPVILSGSLGLLRCFAGTSVPTIVISPDPEDLAFFSRHCGARRIMADPARDPEAATRDLLRLGQIHADRPVLHVGDDATLRLVSRRRDELAPHYRFLLPPHDLVDALLDRARLPEIAARAGLPLGVEAGAEAPVMSFYAWLDEHHQPIGHFIGRTTPFASGGPGAFIELVSDPDVARAGAEIAARLGLVGAVAIDLTRGPKGGPLALLGVKPRFGGWSHLGAACGVNLPLLAHHALTGRRAPAQAAGTTPARWLSLSDDVRVLHHEGAPTNTPQPSVPQLIHVLRGPTIYDVFAWNDASPFFVGLYRALRAKGRRVMPALRGEVSL